MTGNNKICAQVYAHGDGSLEAADRARFESHLANCPQCDEWLETYRFFASELQCARQVSSLELARFAVDPESLGEDSRRRVRAHVESCAECRREFDVTRRALGAARRPSRPTRFAGSIAGPGAMPRRAVVAATVLLLTVVAVLLVERPGGGPPLPFDQPLRAERVLKGEGTLMLEGLEVGQGGHLVARARRSVVLGNGFTVASGGSLTVETERGEPFTD